MIVKTICFLRANSFLNLESCHPSVKQKKSPKKLNPFVKISELAYAIMANSADADQTSSGSLRVFFCWQNHMFLSFSFTINAIVCKLFISPWLFAHLLEKPWAIPSGRKTDLRFACFVFFFYVICNFVVSIWSLVLDGKRFCLVPIATFRTYLSAAYQWLPVYQ